MNNRVGLCVSELPQANCTVRQLDAARLLHDFFFGGEYKTFGGIFPLQMPRINTAALLQHLVSVSEGDITTQN